MAFVSFLALSSSASHLQFRGCVRTIGIQLMFVIFPRRDEWSVLSRSKRIFRIILIRREENDP